MIGLELPYTAKRYVIRPRSTWCLRARERAERKREISDARGLELVEKEARKHNAKQCCPQCGKRVTRFVLIRPELRNPHKFLCLGCAR